MAERSSPNVMMVSLLAGLAGAGLALLFAPASGKETRQKIHERADKLKGNAEESLQDVKKSVSSGIDRFASAIKTTSDKATDEFEEFSDDKKRSTSKESPVLHSWEEEV